MGESIYPWDLLEKGGGDLAEDPGDYEGKGEEAAVAEAGGTAGDTGSDGGAEPAGAGRATGRQTRCSPHGGDQSIDRSLSSAPFSSLVTSRSFGILSHTVPN